MGGGWQGGRRIQAAATTAADVVNMRLLSLRKMKTATLR